MLWSFLNFYEKYQPNYQTLAVIIPSLIIMQIGIAYLAMQFYDLPIRNWLTKRFKNRKELK